MFSLSPNVHALLVATNQIDGRSLINQRHQKSCAVWHLFFPRLQTLCRRQQNSSSNERELRSLHLRECLGHAGVDVCIPCVKKVRALCGADSSVTPLDLLMPQSEGKETNYDLPRHPSARPPGAEIFMDTRMKQSIFYP